MSAIKQWAFSLCATMVACGILQMLMPKSNLEKMLRLVVSVFFLCCVLSPIVLRSPELMVDIEVASDQEIAERSRRVTELAESQARNAAAFALEQMVAGKLSQMGINAHALTININTNGQNAVELASAEIVLDETYKTRHDTLVRELEAELGVTVMLTYREG